jgi:hypothetical protein
MRPCTKWRLNQIVWGAGGRDGGNWVVGGKGGRKALKP